MNLVILALCGVAGAVAVAQPLADDGGGHHGGHYKKQPDGYFMYLNVPRHKEYEAGFNRGNEKHSISRFDQVKDHRFRTRVKWSDAHDGYGEHYFEYNHAPKYPEYHKEPSYHPPAPAYDHKPIIHEPIYDPKPDPYSPH